MYSKIIWLVKILFLIFSIYFISNVDLTKINFFNFNQIISIIVLFTFHFLRVYRLLLIFNSLKIKVSFTDILNIYYIGLFLGIVTPGRLGELYRIKIINDLGISKISNYNFLISEKVLDVLSVLFFVFLIVTFQYSETIFLNIIFSFFIFLIITIFISKFYILLMDISKYVYTKLFRKNKKFDFKVFFENNPFEIIKSIKFIQLFILSFLFWLVFIYAFNIGINSSFSFTYLEAIQLFVINVFVTSVPISFMGLGLREIALVKFLNFQNLELVAMISIQFIYFNLATIVVGIILYIRREIK